MVDSFSDAEHYDSFMGRFSRPLAEQFVAELNPQPGDTVLDVGCGPGIVTETLVGRLGPGRVSGVDPSAAFVHAAALRVKGADIRIASAESLPFADGEFDLTLAQLVLHFLTVPVEGILEMSRVTRPGGFVAANVWDFHGGRGPLGIFEKATLDLNPDAPVESRTPTSSEGELAALFASAGLMNIRSDELTVDIGFESFDAWWHPFTLGVGPAGAYVASLDAAHRERLREHARELSPTAPFSISATAWVCIAQKPT